VSSVLSFRVAHVCAHVARVPRMSNSRGMVFVAVSFAIPKLSLSNACCRLKFQVDCAQILFCGFLAQRLHTETDY